MDQMVDAVMEQRGLEPEELHGAGSDPDVAALVQSVVADEVALATGIPTWDAQARAAFVAHPYPALARLRDGLQFGTCSWERARRVFERIRTQSAVVADVVCARVLAPTRDGGIASWALFGQRLSRAMAQLGDTERERAAALQTRNAWVRPTENGTAQVGIDGARERALAAYARVDQAARTLRAEGDKRSLGQLRSDIALDLLICGDLADFPGDLPAGRVQVSVSLASLVGASDAPGLVRGAALSAAVVREIALREGSVLARIVSDPIDGSALEVSTDKYKPTEQMRRFVRARYRSCVAPGCAHDATTSQLDHGLPWPLGETTAKNLSPKDQRHHQYKTLGWWHATQDPDGTIRWSTLTGRYTTYPHRYDDDLYDPGITTIPIRSCGCTLPAPDTPSNPDAETGAEAGAEAGAETIADAETTASMKATADAGTTADAGRRAYPPDITVIQLDAYRRHRETCTRPDHTDCAGHTAWDLPGIPDERCGIARRKSPDTPAAAARAVQGIYTELDSTSARHEPGPDTGYAAGEGCIAGHGRDGSGNRSGATAEATADAGRLRTRPPGPGRRDHEGVTSHCGNVSGAHAHGTEGSPEHDSQIEEPPF